MPQHRFPVKHRKHFACSDTSPYFASASGWVANNWIFIFGWTYPLIFASSWVKLNQNCIRSLMPGPIAEQTSDSFRSLRRGLSLNYTSTFHLSVRLEWENKALDPPSSIDTKWTLSCRIITEATTFSNNSNQIRPECNVSEKCFHLKYTLHMVEWKEKKFKTLFTIKLWSDVKIITSNYITDMK